METLDEAIQKTDELLGKSSDPAMLEVRKQLLRLKSGQETQTSIGRIVAYNYTPAPTAEIQQWADLVLKAWQESQNSKGQL